MSSKAKKEGFVIGEGMSLKTKSSNKKYKAPTPKDVPVPAGKARKYFPGQDASMKARERVKRTRDADYRNTKKTRAVTPDPDDNLRRMKYKKKKRR
jgi:hypothetical protein